MFILLFLPYLILYLFAWRFVVPVAYLEPAVWILHAVNAAYLIKSVVHQARSTTRFPAVFWTVLTLVFLAGGAYLEYPSDPWEHFRRIGQWEGLRYIHEYGTANKFAYFWAWTFFHHVPLALKPAFLDVYSAFWQLLVAIQFFRFVRKLGVEGKAAYVQVVGFLVLFGTNIFTFRYYVLSSTALAYIAYLQALGIVLDWKRHSPARNVATIAGLLLIMVYNHIQEPLLFLINTVAIMAYHLGKKWRVSEKIFWRTALIVGGIGLLLAPLLGKLSHESAFLIWSSRRLYLDTYGVHGLVSLLVALFLYRRYPLVALLCWAPTLCLAFPPAAWTLRRVLADDYATYRVLFATPLSLMVVLGIQNVLQFIGPRWSEHRRAIASVVLILVVALPPWYPWRGRLLFAIARVHPALRLERQIATAKWFDDNRSQKEQKKLVTDIMTRFALEGYLGNFGTPFPWQEGFRTAPTERALSLSAPNIIWVTATFDRYHINRALVVDVEKTIAMPLSRVGRWSGHWGPIALDQKGLIKQPYLDALESLRTERGWGKTAVPPYYWLYEAPEATK